MHLLLTMPDRPVRRVFLLIALAIIYLAVASCLPNRPVPTTGPGPSSTLPVQTETSVATVEAGPTAEFSVDVTPSPAASHTPRSGVVTLLAPTAADPLLLSQIEPGLAQLAAETGWQFEKAAMVSPDSLAGGKQFVVALAPLPDLPELVSSAPGTAFLAVGIQGLAPASNLSVIGPEGSGSDQQGFIAGVIAAMTTPDWRVGVIAPPEADGQSARQGFENGVIYFCGLCRPVYPPYYDSLGVLIDYPVSFSLSAQAGDAERQAVLAALKDQAVTSVYLAPGAAGEVFISELAGAGFRLLAGSPPPEAASTQWIATVRSDPMPAVEAAWEGLLAGQGGESFAMPLVIDVGNETLFSPGRQVRANEVLTDLLAGWIDTTGTSDQ